VNENVFYSEPLVRQLEQSLRVGFKQPYMQLTRSGASALAGDVRITLAPGQSNQRLVSGEGTSPEQLVMEIVTESNRRSGFWFGFVAVFQLAGSRKHILQHVSILVFHDIAGELLSLFRAEWDQLDVANPTSKHAQPHWHFTQSPARIESVIRALTATSEIEHFVPEAGSDLFTGLADPARFHFAMTSLWEEGKKAPYQKCQFNSEQFPKWFKNLTEHIADQISYLISHMPLADMSAVVEFVPTQVDG
jgi:hypothetical protein